MIGQEKKPHTFVKLL